MTSHQAIKRMSLFCVLFLATVPYGQRLGAEGKNALVEEAALRDASTKAIKRIQHSQGAWYKKQTCSSCHHQLLPELTLNLARSRGVGFDETVARTMTAEAFAYLKDLDGVVQGYDYIDVLFDGWSLVAAYAAGVKPSLATAASAQFIASQQLPDGSWRTIDSRPPQAHSPFATTAVCAQAIQQYLPDQFKAEKESRTQRARAWLLKAQARTTEDRAFQLLGMRWTSVEEGARKNVARQLLAQQREDGGWAQLPDLPSDAYATGEVLVALKEAGGIATSDPAVQRGMRFLLKTQQADGSWRVKSRLNPPAPVSPPYTDTEFPYQHDQFISIMGTSWASAALMQALASLEGEMARRFSAPDIAPSESNDWIRAAMIGSPIELKKLLDTGMSPNVKTREGTTALMLAARDLEKTRMLLDRGADVNARAATGVTPLMVAARYRGNAEVVRLLLKKGAKPNTDKGVEVRNDATAHFFAVMAGDTQTLGALLDAGARLTDRMKILGVFYTGPLIYATLGGDLRMIEYLIGRGASPNELDDDGLSVLEWATLTNQAGAVQTLLARGAKVNHVDKLGMTPILYAASIDYGDTTVMEKLLAAGADRMAKNKQGLSALNLARNYNHSKMASLLSRKTARRTD